MEPPAGETNASMTPESLPENSSMLGRLLEELSWEGSNIRHYRRGGRGRENVLTAEVFAPLSYLPRSLFLAPVLRSAQGAAAVLQQAASEAEHASITLLPEQSWLSHGGTVVQPDGLITTPSCRGLIEAKGMSRSAFQPEQLAREYICAVRDAGSRLPLLLLVLPNEPPVPVKKHGLLSIEDAIGTHLQSVLARTTGLAGTAAVLMERVAETVAWITWPEVQDVVRKVEIENAALPSGIGATIERLRSDLVRAIDWHSGR